MERANPDNLRVRISPGRRLRERLFREWCFFQAIVKHRGLSVLFLLVILWVASMLLAAETPASGAAEVGAFERIYTAWSLIFGQPPAGNLPTSWMGRAMLFILPLLGLTVIIDAIVEIGSMVRDRRAHERSWCMIMSRSMKDHVILVGLGKLGYRTFRILRRLGHSVVIIEGSERNKFLDEVRADGSPLLIGDARRDELLREAGVERARSIILATSDDLVNLEAALDARRMNPTIRVVLRMFDQQMADKVREGFNIKIAMSQSSISAPAFATAAIEPAIVGSVVVSDELVVMVRWSVDRHPQIAGLTISELLARHGMSVVERTPAGGERKLFPPPDTRIERGDELLLQGAFETLTTLRGV
ncbi:MAG: NAD-binding protein [Phycisphaerales bacterium]|nr:NAD-binding protein [Phycisphaerales bacterium]